MPSAADTLKLQLERDSLKAELANETENLRELEKLMSPSWSVLKSLREQILETFDRTKDSRHMILARSGNLARRVQLQRDMDAVNLAPAFCEMKQKRRELQTMLKKFEHHLQKLNRDLRKAKAKAELAAQKPRKTKPEPEPEPDGGADQGELDL
jgi:hypothetical protein